MRSDNRRRQNTLSRWRRVRNEALLCRCHAVTPAITHHFVPRIWFGVGISMNSFRFLPFSNQVSVICTSSFCDSSYSVYFIAFCSMFSTPTPCAVRIIVRFDCLNTCFSYCSNICTLRLEHYILHLLRSRWRKIVRWVNE